nr:D-alanine--D-alanine ligase [Natronoglycomyces albus]
MSDAAATTETDALDVMVIAGGMSYERDISMRSGQRIASALQRRGVSCELHDLDKSLLHSIRTNPPQVLFPALHGAAGEDGSLRKILELLDVPFVGATASGSRRAWNKDSAKDLLRQANLPTPDWMVLSQTAFSDYGAADLLDSIVERFGLPLAVKPTAGGSGLGVHVVENESDFPGAMMGCFAYGDKALLEKYVAGRDIAVAVVDLGEGPEALPAVEIAPLSGVYDFVARYNAGATRWHVPARLDKALSQQVAELAIAAHDVLGLRDLSRVDMMVSDDGQVRILEVNVAPGMTDTSLWPMGVEAAQRDFADVLVALIEQAKRRRS